MQRASKSVMVVSVGAVLLAGCFGGVADQAREVGEALEELDAAVNESQNAENDVVDDGGTNSAANDVAEEQPGLDDALGGDSSTEEAGTDAVGENQADATGIDQPLDVEVSYHGLVYAFTEMNTLELNEGRGSELTFAVDIHNPGSETLMPSAPVTLRWNEPGSDNTIEVAGRTDFRSVPGGASASGEVVVHLLEHDHQLYDEQSARLIVGVSGQSAAQAPIGATAEIIDRTPVAQPDLEGKQLELDDLTVTITAADLRWHGPNGPMPDGEAVVEFEYTMDNSGDSQFCARRGAGSNFSLTRADGEGFVDLGVDERCVAAGQSAESLTGVAIREPFAGEYTLEFDPESLSAGEITFELVATD